MEKIEVIANLTFVKKMVLELEENEDEADKVFDMIDSFTEKESKEFHTSSNCTLVLEDFSIRNVVKKVIDNFDPIGLSPGNFAPSNEYNPQSRRIAMEIEPDMNEEEIAAIIAEELNFSFGQDLTMEYCLTPAKEILYYLK